MAIAAQPLTLPRAAGNRPGPHRDGFALFTQPLEVSKMSTRCYRRRPFVAAASGALTALVAGAPAYAAVEFVTPVGQCNTIVDRIGDGKDLSLQAGQNVRFEVWGSGIDVNAAVSGDDAAVNARIIRAHSGIANTGRCGRATGSVEVEVDSPANTTQTLQRTLRFRMPLGDTSPLQIRVVPFPAPQWTFNANAVLQDPANCLTKGLTQIVADQQSTRITIDLPPGAAQDSSNCTLRLFTHVRFPGMPDMDIRRDFNLTLTGLPNFLTLYGPTPLALPSTWSSIGKSITLEANIAHLRAINSARNVTLSLATPNGRSDALTVRVNPPPVANAFAQAAICRNPSTGTTINAGDAFGCELRLAQTPPAGGQTITFEAIDRQCVAAGSPAVTYSSATGIGTFNAPATGTIHQIPLRSVNGSGSTGQPCASLSGVAHLLKFWIGPRDTESGPDFSQTQIRVRALQ